jgi:hypothetical protein
MLVVEINYKVDSDKVFHLECFNGSNFNDEKTTEVSQELLDIPEIKVEIK